MTNSVSSLYIHVPYCRHLCNYCDFFKKKLEDSDAQFSEFETYLRDSWSVHQEWMKQHQIHWSPIWDSLYLGGGTPSLWGERGAHFLKELLPHQNIKEFTLEVDPGTWSEAMFKAWTELGVNRLSIGTQSLDPQFLKVLDRAHSLDESYLLLEKGRSSGINFSFDFLLGVPHSQDRKRNIIKELEEFLKFSPHHVSLYILNARSKYPLTNHLPDDDYIRGEYLDVCAFLEEHGLYQYEVSNFARPGFESIHNKKYWNSENVAALGPTGTGLIKFSDDKAIRYKWKPGSPRFEEEFLGHEELELERVYLELRTRTGWAPHPEQMGPKLLQTLDSWQKRNLLKAMTPRVILNSQGLVILDSLMDELFQSGI